MLCTNGVRKVKSVAINHDHKKGLFFVSVNNVCLVVGLQYMMFHNLLLFTVLSRTDS